jgi:hypothetical protein
VDRRNRVQLVDEEGCRVARIRRPQGSRDTAGKVVPAECLDRVAVEVLEHRLSVARADADHRQTKSLELGPKPRLGQPHAALQRWGAAMERYIGLDVSLKQTSICVVNLAGALVREGVIDSDPEAIAAFVRSNAPNVVGIGLETGPTAKALCLGADLRPPFSRCPIPTVRVMQSQTTADFDRLCFYSIEDDGRSRGSRNEI